MSGLRRRAWAPDHFRATLDVAPSGVPVGVDADGVPLTLALLVPTSSTRVGIVGDRQLARLLAVRLLALSCDLTVVTADHASWHQLATALPETPFAVSAQLRRWPEEGTPPPWALLIDMAEPPPPGFTRAPWSTVVHSVATLPGESSWWQSAHVILVGRDHAEAVLAFRPRLDRTAVAELRADEVLAVTASHATVVRLAPTDEERALLGGDRRRMAGRHSLS